MSETTENVNLPVGTRVDNYVISKVIGGGGFSIVYLGHVVDSGAQVVIKEYMPRKLAKRASDGKTVRTEDEAAMEKFTHGRRLFFQEASILATLKHPTIVNVINFFRANDTVYMVTEFHKGIDLQAYIRRHKGNLSEELIRKVFTRLLDGLKAIHGHDLLHLDIKPGNIYLRAHGEPLLLDFGAVHQQQQSRKYQPGQVVTLGYSPIEQSMAGGYVGPWSDIYALGATMRTCIEGVAPPPAEKRRLNDTMRPAVETFKKHYSSGLLAVIDWATEVDPLHRPQSVDELFEAMNDPGKRDDKRQNSSVLERIANSLPWGKG
ncbi:serine/threonine protein kinase [Thiohalomonas denitrificans]|uniref:serine/threonine protein kinase n=1 Tax=Thiohalomonas denitrificans TaxID=415747 RepID=UPI0026EFAE64|nr:serine/threonine-protein kinase [Thiohalomonas denitrificans]